MQVGLCTAVLNLNAAGGKYAVIQVRGRWGSWYWEWLRNVTVSCYTLNIGVP